MPVNASIADYNIISVSRISLFFHHSIFGVRLLSPLLLGAPLVLKTVRHRRHHFFLLFLLLLLNILFDGSPLRGPQPVQFSVRRKIKQKPRRRRTFMCMRSMARGMRNGGIACTRPRRLVLLLVAGITCYIIYLYIICPARPVLFFGPRRDRVHYVHLYIYL